MLITRAESASNNQTSNSNVVDYGNIDSHIDLPGYSSKTQIQRSIDNKWLIVKETMKGSESNKGSLT